MEMDDLPVVINIEKSIYPDPWDTEMFFNEINLGSSYVIEDTKDTRIIGYLCGMQVLNEFSIMNIAIARNYQKLGYGSMLIKSVIDLYAVKGCTDFFLEVRIGNRQAINLYTKFGFRTIGRRRNYYRNPPEDALIMRLNYRFPTERLTLPAGKQINEKI